MRAQYYEAMVGISDVHTTKLYMTLCFRRTQVSLTECITVTQITADC